MVALEVVAYRSQSSELVERELLGSLLELGLEQQELELGLLGLELVELVQG